MAFDSLVAHEVAVLLEFADFVDSGGVPDRVVLLKHRLIQVEIRRLRKYTHLLLDRTSVRLGLLIRQQLRIDLEDRNFIARLPIKTETTTLVHDHVRSSVACDACLRAA